jgi:hypothetical protein
MMGAGFSSGVDLYYLLHRILSFALLPLNILYYLFYFQILNELTATLVYLDRQDACKTILMMGAGFSSGVDLAYLLSDNKNKRRRNATNMANALK